MLPALPGLLEAHGGRAVCVLASGDPMFFGVGGTLVRLLGADRVRVIPHPSSASLACARLGWALERTEVVSAVGRPVEGMLRFVGPGRRIVVLSADGTTPARVAALLTERGYGPSALTVLEELGGPGERVLTGTAAGWPHQSPASLNVVAVECAAEAGAAVLPCVPGLPDEAYDHDGQLTKREVRAVTLAALAPVPGELLWDVGAGAGSIGIEWMRAHPGCRAIAVEDRPGRAERIVRNAAALGVPGLRVVTGRAPGVLYGLDRPDVIFIGGGLTVPGLLETCWERLPVGGRLVVNAVTMESEAVVTEAYGRLGGEISRIAVSRARPVGGFTGWTSMMPVTIWTTRKGEIS
jgi:precorrin-6Y C5,15-methyltransferase (decarboxylating)